MFDISPGVVVIYEPRVDTIGGGGTVLNHMTVLIRGKIGFEKRGTFQTNPDAEKALTGRGKG